MDSVRLSIVILNYKTAGLVKQCLKGLKAMHSNFSYEIIVVDNNSQDNIKLILDKDFKDVKFIEAKRNKGFAAGNNLGIKQAQGRLIMILNPDIAVLEGSLNKMMEFLEAHDNVGMVVPKLLNPDRSLQYSTWRFPPLLMPIYRRTFLGKTKPAQKVLDWYLMKDKGHDKNQPIAWALGACMMIKREAIKDVGLFDERYFLYVEDTDWCRRFWLKGWQIYYVSDAKMIHYHMRESAERFFSKLNFIHLTSWLKYFWKFKGKSKIKIT